MNAQTINQASEFYSRPEYRHLYKQLHTKIIRLLTDFKEVNEQKPRLFQGHAGEFAGLLQNEAQHQPDCERHKPASGLKTI